MRINIDIDDELLREAQRLTGISTVEGTVEEALKKLIQLKRQAEVRAWRGKLKWEGDLEKQRLDHDDDLRGG